MLTCIPQSLCTWNFRVLGAEAGRATVIFNCFSEQGTIELGKDQFAIVKHGPMSGWWTLERSGTVYAEARKPNAMLRSFEVQAGEAKLNVKAQSPFARTFDIIFEEQCIGTIRPAHLLTRRALVECRLNVPEIVQLFAFWLAALTWRRAAQSNS